jgi:hypothetical protein
MTRIVYSCASTRPVVSKFPGQTYYYAGAGYLNNFYYDQASGVIRLEPRRYQTTIMALTQNGWLRLFEYEQSGYRCPTFRRLRMT